MDLPYSVEDLRTLADALEEWNKLLISDDGQYREMAGPVSQIEVLLPV
jgi:hypothetical protein